MTGWKRRFNRLLNLPFKVVLTLLFLLGMEQVPTYASTSSQTEFIIEAGSIQGEMLPPKIVFLNENSSQPTPAVEFDYKQATITGMTLYQQLNTEKGPMLVKITAPNSIYVTNMKVVATSFSFGGACLDTTKLNEPLILKNVKMAATEMTSGTMDTQGLGLETSMGSSPVQPPSVPGFLQSILNENSFNTMQQAASKLDLLGLLFNCQGSASSGKTSKNPVTSIIGQTTQPITNILGNDPVGSITDPVTKLPSQVTTVIEKGTGTVGSITKKLPSQVGSVLQKGTDTATKVVGTVEQTLPKVTEPVAPVINQSQVLLGDLQQKISDGLSNTDQLGDKITTLQSTISNIPKTLQSIQSLLANPLNLLQSPAGLLQQLAQLQNTVQQAQSTENSLSKAEAALEQELQAVQDQINSANLGSKLNTDDWVSKLNNEKNTLSNLQSQLQSLNNQITSLQSKN